jgi:Sec-independent protein translocase protein TatA
VFGIGGSELLIIGVIALVLTGGGALPFIAGYFMGKNRGEREKAPRTSKTKVSDPEE